MTDATDHADHEHQGSVGLFLAVFLGLCLLTTLSFLTYFDFWRERVPMEISRLFMMAVSCTKALLVILFFMHLKWEANWKWVLTVPASMMSIFLVLVLIPDVGLRMHHASYQRLIHAAEVPAVGHDAESTGDHGPNDHTDPPGAHGSGH